MRETFVPRLPDASVLAVRRAGGTWLGTDTAEVLCYRQALDTRNARVLRTLVLREEDVTTRIDEIRFTSFASPSIFVIMWRVTACDWSGELEVVDGIDGAVRNSINEREQQFGGRHLGQLVHHLGPDGMLVLTAKLTGASVDIALGTRTKVHCQNRDNSDTVHSWADEQACFRSSCSRVDEGGTVTIAKTVTVHTSRDPLVLDPVETALADHNAYPYAASRGLDNNAYTNVMAMWTLLTACEALERLSKADYAALACRIALGKDEPRRWAEIAKLLFVPLTENDVIEQFEGFDSLRRYHNPRQATPPYQRTDWASERNGDTVDAWQIVKQPDVLMLFYLLGQRRVVALLRNAGYKFSEAAARRTIDYYLARITQESTLSKVVCAGAIAPSDKELSLRYLRPHTRQISCRGGAARKRAFTWAQCPESWMSLCASMPA
ncbi:putative Trehalose and maltose hydrolase (phosphorylase) (plasmid) [Caballeronia sp. S22]